MSSSPPSVSVPLSRNVTLLKKVHFFFSPIACEYAHSAFLDERKTQKQNNLPTRRQKNQENLKTKK